MDENSHISNHLSRVLEYIGASEECRKLYWETAKIQEISVTIIQKLVLQTNSSTYTFGSICEGTTTLGLNADTDALMCLGEVTVIEDIHQEKFDKINYLIVQDKTTKPGYVKLQNVLFQMPGKYVSENEEKDNLGRVLLKHLYGMQSVESEYILKERNGPADTISVGLDGFHFDYVNGLRCDQIPTFTCGWIHRKRPYGWPSKQLLDKMSTYGCFFVGVGHPTSPDKHLEWRVSFSLQERELMVSLNPTQHKCYILLKMIKKDIIEPQVGKSITSYHCKTSLFYTIENTSTDTWTPENLIQCVQLCLTQLLFWLAAENCPNYFIPDENMFDRLHSDLMRQAASVIQTILDNGCDFIWSLSCDGIGLLTHQSIGGLPVFIYKSEQHAVIMRESYITRYTNYQRDLVNILIEIGSNKTIDFILTLRNLVTELQEIKTITEHTAEDVRVTTSALTQHIHLHIAQCIAALLSAQQNEDNNKQMLRSFEDHINEAENCDLISAKLVQATLSFKLQNFYACEQFLLQSEIRITDDVLTVCDCVPLRNRNYKYPPMKLRTEEFTYKRYLTTVIAGCMIFLPSQEGFIPDVLIFEKFRSVQTSPYSRLPSFNGKYWLDWIVVDSKVYLCLLQYLLYSRINKQTKKARAIDTLYQVLQTDIHLGHRETGYNILGWIYMTEDEPLAAMQCFLTSWRIRPHHNAAKWHALVLIHNSKH